MAWEREASLADIYHDSRIEELGCSDDSDARTGVGLNFSRMRFASDPLKFTGIDLGAQRRARRSYVYQASASEASSDGEGEGSEWQIAMREKEDALVRAAMARIKRARGKGKTDVRLTQEELEALNRYEQRLQAQEASVGGEGRRRSDKVTVSIAPWQERRRKPFGENSQPQPPGMLVAGPDGNLIYAPLGQYPPQAISNGSPHNSSNASSSRNSPSSRSPSATQQSRDGNSPLGYYAQPPNARHVSDPQNSTLSHPSSSPHLRDPLPHEEGWTRVTSASSQHSSISSTASSRHSQRTRHPGESPRVDPFAYLNPFAYQIDEAENNDQSIPGQFLESPVSRHPRDVVYSNVRRSLPGPTIASPSSSRISSPYSTSDPALSRPRTRAQQNRPNYEEPPSSTSSSSDAEYVPDIPHGVKVYPDRDEDSSSTNQMEKSQRPGSSRDLPARKPVGNSGNGSAKRAKKGRKGK